MLFKKIRIILLGLFFPTCASQPINHPISFWEHDLKKAKKEAQDQKKPILVKIEEEGCHGCKLQDKFLTLPSSRKFLTPYVRLSLDKKRLMAAQKDEPLYNFTKTHDIDLNEMMLPILVLINDQKTIIIEGFLPKNEILNHLKDFSKIENN